MRDDLVTVWCLTILHRSGSELYIFKDKAIARQQLFEYVRDCWKEFYPDEIISEDQDEAVEDFFFNNEEVSYILVEEDVLEEPIV